MTLPSTRLALRSLSYASFLVLAACGGTVATTDAGGDETANSDVVRDVSQDAGFDVPANDVPVADAVIDAQPDVVPVVDAGCAFDTTYTYGYSGGFRVATDSSTLAPQASYTRTRTPSSGGTPISCMQTIPCGTSGLLDVRAVLAAINDADVQAAMAIGTDTLYGVDARPVDGSVFTFQRASDGHSILVGDPCSGSGTCRAIPAGVASLVTMLGNLDTQEIAMTGCEALR